MRLEKILFVSAILLGALTVGAVGSVIPMAIGANTIVGSPNRVPLPKIQDRVPQAKDRVQNPIVTNTNSAKARSWLEVAQTITLGIQFMLARPSDEAITKSSL